MEDPLRLLPLFTLFFACTGPAKDDTGEPADTDTAADTDTDTTVSFEADVWPMLQESCSGCHSNDQYFEGFLLTDSATAYTTLLNDAPNTAGSYANYVVAGDVAASLLVDKIEASPDYGGLQMPIGGTYPDYTSYPWSEDKIQTVKDWITQGALDN